MWIYPLGMRVILAGGLMAIAALSGAAAGPLQDGRAAFQRRDFAEAMRLWRPLAEQGNNDAQVDLGRGAKDGARVGTESEGLRSWTRLPKELGPIGLALICQMT
jgi:hypothetical protein